MPNVARIAVVVQPSIRVHWAFPRVTTPCLGLAIQFTKSYKSSFLFRMASNMINPPEWMPHHLIGIVTSAFCLRKDSQSAKVIEKVPLIPQYLPQLLSQKSNLRLGE